MEVGVVGFHVVVDAHEARAVPGDLRCLRDHRTHELAAEVNLGVLQDREFPVRGVREAGGRVEHSQDREHPVQLPRRPCASP